MVRATIIIILSFSLTTSLLSVPVTVSEDTYFLDLLETADFEWSEYTDKSISTWQYDVGRVNVNAASRVMLSDVPGISDSLAHAIVMERNKNGYYQDLSELQTRLGLYENEQFDYVPYIEFKRPLQFSGIAHSKISRRIGTEDRINLKRYDGSSESVTQRVIINTNGIEAGFVADKDRYEPSLTDLTRYYGLYNNSKFKIITGYFHISNGFGLALGTSPRFLDSFDKSRAYITDEQNIRPAIETIQNSGLRGLAVSTAFPAGMSLTLFGSDTDYDAIVKDDKVQRLSDTGLHRSPGENEKRDQLNETAFGGIVSWETIVGNYEVKPSITAYFSQFDRILDPEYDPRIRFPLSGRYFSALSGGLSISDLEDKSQLSMELSSDIKKHIALRIGFRKNLSDFFKYYITLYHYPRKYYNPHSRPVSSGSESQNADGGAILIAGSPNLRIVSDYSFHIEVTNHPWRTYTVTRPFSSMKSSLELTKDLSRKSILSIRWRRKNDEDGNGEFNTTSTYREERIRATFFYAGTKIWVESEFVNRSHDSGKYPLMIGLRQNGSIYRVLQYRLALVGFSADAGTHLYAGESGIPDRVASIRLSGQGIRYSCATFCQWNGNTWIGLQLAKNLYRHTPSDLELYAGASYYFKNR